MIDRPFHRGRRGGSGIVGFMDCVVQRKNKNEQGVRRNTAAGVHRHRYRSGENHWAQTLGVGPFFIKRRIAFSNFIYRGKPSTSPSVSIALANSGYVQIELIQQHDDAPSIYREYLEYAEGGLQHVSSWVTTQELLTRKAELVSRGYAIAQECMIPSSGVQLVYFDTGSPSANFMFEMADLMEPDQYQRVLGVRSAHEQWSGEPVVVEVGA